MSRSRRALLPMVAAAVIGGGVGTTGVVSADGASEVRDGRGEGKVFVGFGTPDNPVGEPREFEEGDVVIRTAKGPDGQCGRGPSNAHYIVLQPPAGMEMTAGVAMDPDTCELRVEDVRTVPSGTLEEEPLDAPWGERVSATPAGTDPAPADDPAPAGTEPAPDPAPAAGTDPTDGTGAGR